MATELAVWLRGTRVATLTPASSDGRKVRLRYDAPAFELVPENSPLLSCSLPLGTQKMDATHYLAGLLPEGRSLQAMADLAELATVDTFGLLSRFGRDVAGAVVIAAPDVDPYARTGSVAPYSADELEDAVSALPERPLDLHDDSELSLPGLQNKLLLVETASGWARPRNGHPSTHILKVDDPRRVGLVDAEAACLRLARSAGLTSVDVTVETLGGQRCLIVSRFDRYEGRDGLGRLHQEDLCQATATDLRADRGRGKYAASGGPDLEDAADLLDRYAADPIAQLAELVRVVTFTVGIGNADAHGKNVAFVHREDGTIALSPLYDTVPTVLWPNLRRAPAMPIGSRIADIDDIGRSDIVAAARLWRLREDVANDAVTQVAMTLDAALDDTISADLAEQVAGACRYLLDS